MSGENSEQPVIRLFLGGHVATFGIDPGRDDGSFSVYVAARPALEFSGPFDGIDTTSKEMTEVMLRHHLRMLEHPQHKQMLEIMQGQDEQRGNFVDVNEWCKKNGWTAPFFLEGRWVGYPMEKDSSNREKGFRECKPLPRFFKEDGSPYTLMELCNKRRAKIYEALGYSDGERKVQEVDGLVSTPGAERIANLFCEKEGWTDKFFNEGQWWGFPVGAVMAKKIPFAVNDLERHVGLYLKAVLETEGPEAAIEVARQLLGDDGDADAAD